MNVRAQRKTIHSATCLLALGAVSCAVWVLATRPTIKVSDPTTMSSAATSPPSASSVVTHSADLLQLAQRPLRQALQDAPAAPPPPLALKLSGTVVEAGRSRAVMIGADGKSQLRGVGDLVDGIELIDISADSVTVQYLGNPVVLKPVKGGG